MNLNESQRQVRDRIEYYAGLVGVDPDWACAVAMTESSLGEHRISPTNCRGIFQMSSVAMEDLRLLMGSDDLTEILCGLLFLRLLKRRWGSVEEATKHYCDPKDVGFYVPRMLGYMREFAEDTGPVPVQAEVPPEPPKTWWQKIWG